MSSEIPVKNVDPFALPSIHERMLGDKIRILAYKKAIERSVKKRDTVLDMGCGTGVLSFFAAKKGCARVYAVDKSGIINVARSAAARNGLDGKIRFIRTDLRKLRLRHKADLLIHEHIGSYLWNEGMIWKLKLGRERFLKKTGRLLPEKVDLYLVPVDYVSRLEKKMSYWSKKRFGLDFSDFRKSMFLSDISRAARPQTIALPDTRSFLWRVKMVYSADLKNDTRIPRRIEAVFKLRKGSRLSGMCAFFKVHLDDRHRFSTRPKKTNTHWGQIFLPMFRPARLSKRSALRFILAPREDPNKWRFRFELLS